MSLRTQSQISPKKDLFFSLPAAASLLPLSWWVSFSNILGSLLRVQLTIEEIMFAKEALDIAVFLVLVVTTVLNYMAKKKKNAKGVWKKYIKHQQKC